MSVSECELGPSTYCGVDLRLWERVRLKNGQERLPDILDRILLLGLKVKATLYQERTDPTERDTAILFRTRQVLKAAATTVLMEANCSTWLLRAHGYISPHGTSPLSDFEEWMA